MREIFFFQIKRYLKFCYEKRSREYKTKYNTNEEEIKFLVKKITKKIF